MRRNAMRVAVDVRLLLLLLSLLLVQARRLDRLSAAHPKCMGDLPALRRVSRNTRRGEEEEWQGVDMLYLIQHTSRGTSVPSCVTCMARLGDGG